MNNQTRAAATKDPFIINVFSESSLHALLCKSQLQPGHQWRQWSDIHESLGCGNNKPLSS